MLNQKNKRELAYLATVTQIAAMDADRLECVYINGWTCVCGKGEFKVGDVGIFFEPDSKLPAVAPFNEMDFLVKKDYKVKPQKIRGVVSQGLFIPISAFHWSAIKNLNTMEIVSVMEDDEKTLHSFNDESKFLTQKFNVTYAVTEDNTRKSSYDKYKVMAQRRPNIFKKKWVQWFMRRSWGKKLMFLFFGRKKDKKNDYPSWVVKTDEERCQNLPNLFTDAGRKIKWIATEKIDGTSTTFTMKNDRRKDLIVCSRNVVFNTPQKEEKNWYKDTDGNVYLEMANKYNMKQVCKNAIAYFENKNTPLNFVTIQGETFGGTIQKRDYGKEHRLAIFNVIFGFKNGEIRRLNPVEMKEFLIEIQPENSLTLISVPIVDCEFFTPATCDELLMIAGGNSQIDGKMREGLVFRSEDGRQSFKAVDPNFLVKYHS